jgi:hypothetical protein
MDTSKAIKNEMNRRYLQKSVSSDLRGRVKSKWTREFGPEFEPGRRRFLSLRAQKDERSSGLSTDEDCFSAEFSEVDTPEESGSTEEPGVRYVGLSVSLKQPNHSHAWKGVWDRPVKVDEDFYHPFTIARMTNHKVRCCDAVTESDQAAMERMENEGGKGTRIV